MTSVGCAVRSLLSGPCPVIYYIHGGGFMFDTPVMYPESTIIDNFVSQGIVFVTVGYRLGTFGFWQTPVGGAGGNYGLHGQLGQYLFENDHIL